MCFLHRFAIGDIRLIASTKPGSGSGHGEITRCRFGQNKYRVMDRSGGERW